MSGASGQNEAQELTCRVGYGSPLQNNEVSEDPGKNQPLAFAANNWLTYSTGMGIPFSVPSTTNAWPTKP